MNGKLRAWMVVALIVALVSISVAAIAATGTRQSWGVRHGTIIQRIADKFLTTYASGNSFGSRMVSAQELKTNLNDGNSANDPLIIDVANVGGISEAQSIGTFADMAKSATLAKLDALLAGHSNDDIVVYCGSGFRGAIITAIWGMLGYDVKNLTGGLEAYNGTGSTTTTSVSTPSSTTSTTKGG